MATSRRSRGLAILGGLFLAVAIALPAHANLLVYDLTTAFQDGPLANTAADGVLSFDSSIIPSGYTGTLQNLNGLPDVASLTYRQNGVVYDLSNTGVFQLAFQNGQLSGIGFGGDTSGITTIKPFTEDILAATTGYCAYTTSSANQTGDCSVSLTKVNPQIVTEDFTTTITSGSLDGKTYQGQFSYNAAIIPAGGTGSLSSSSVLDDFLNFSYNLDGTNYSTANAEASQLNFTNGALSGFIIGVRPQPGDLGAGTTSFSLINLSYNHSCGYITPNDSFP